MIYHMGLQVFTVTMVYHLRPCLFIISQFEEYFTIINHNQCSPSVIKLLWATIVPQVSSPVHLCKGILWPWSTVNHGLNPKLTIASTMVIIIVNHGWPWLTMNNHGTIANMRPGKNTILTWWWDLVSVSFWLIVSNTSTNCLLTFINNC